MCVIIVGRGETVPSRAMLERACRCNPDGFGWALVIEHSDGSRDLISGRSMIARDAISDFKHAVRDHKGDILASLFHARIATHGAVSLALCHPFEVPGSRAVLAHNGILPVSTKGSPLSDSAIFAREYVPALGGAVALRSPYVAHIVEEFAAGSKLVILDPDQLEPLQILNEDYGIWHKDLWHSNESALERSSSWIPKNWDGFGYGDYDYGSYPAATPSPALKAAVEVFTNDEMKALGRVESDSSTYFDDYPSAWKCRFCASVVDGRDAEYGWCPYCDTCQGCALDWDKCECTDTQSIAAVESWIS